MARTRAHVRDALQRERELLLEGLSREQAKGPAASADTADVADVATSRIEQFTDDRERQRRAERVSQIEAALQRLEKGTWGQCERCEGKIAGARMQALPTANLCVDCASRR